MADLRSRTRLRRNRLASSMYSRIGRAGCWYGRVGRGRTMDIYNLIALVIEPDPHSSDCRILANTDITRDNGAAIPTTLWSRIGRNSRIGRSRYSWKCLRWRSSWNSRIGRSWMSRIGRSSPIGRSSLRSPIGRSSSGSELITARTATHWTMWRHCGHSPFGRVIQLPLHSLLDAARAPPMRQHAQPPLPQHLYIITYTTDGKTEFQIEQLCVKLYSERETPPIPR